MVKEPSIVEFRFMAIFMTVTLVLEKVYEIANKIGCEVTQFEKIGMYFLIVVICVWIYLAIKNVWSEL